MLKKTAFLFILAGALAPLAADVLLTRDGARLTGEIKLIDEGVIHLETGYAGVIQVRQEEVLSFETEEPIKVRMADGSVEASHSGEPASSEIAAAWRVRDWDPALARAEDEWQRQQMKWSMRTVFDMSGREGTTQEFNLGAKARATLANENHALTLHGLYEEREQEGRTTEDRILGGAGYERFFSDTLGWYARSEMERDRPDRIDLRSTSNGGLSYRILREEDHSLVFRSGFGYRYTEFQGSEPSEADPTLDPAIAHLYRFGDRYLVQTDLRYVPSINDFDAYQITQDTGFEMPVGDSEGLKFRIGLRNRYDSETVTDDALDTAYYTQLVMDWQ